MPNSPKCPECLKNEVIAQTFRRAASTEFKCHICKTTFQVTDFEPIEFEWLEKPKEWNIFNGLRQSTPILNGRISKSSKSKTKKKVKN